MAPVGYAWMMELRKNPQTELWQEDGSHPTLEGTYLAACVFYAAIFDQSPVGLAYQAGLPAETALELQSMAEQVVFENRARWGLGE